MTEYVAFIHKDANQGFAITYADFPELVAFAAFLEGAPELAASRLTLHMIEVEEAGHPIPAPRSLAVLQADPRHAGWVEAVTLIRGAAFWAVGDIVAAGDS